MSESEAKRLGLAIHDADGTLGTGTGVRVGFRTAVAPLRWSKDGLVEIVMRSGSPDRHKANLFVDDDHLVIAAYIGQRRILATLDTGAQTTGLYDALAKESPIW